MKKIKSLSEQLRLNPGKVFAFTSCSGLLGMLFIGCYILLKPVLDISIANVIYNLFVWFLIGGIAGLLVILLIFTLDDITDNIKPKKLKKPKNKNKQIGPDCEIVV